MSRSWVGSGSLPRLGGQPRSPEKLLTFGLESGGEPPGQGDPQVKDSPSCVSVARLTQSPPAALAAYMA